MTLVAELSHPENTAIEIRNPGNNYGFAPEEIRHPETVKHEHFSDKVVSDIVCKTIQNEAGLTIDEGLYVDFVKIVRQWPEYLQELARVHLNDITSVDKGVASFYKEIDGKKYLWRIDHQGGNQREFNIYREDVPESPNGKKHWVQIGMQREYGNKLASIRYQSDEESWRNPNANQPFRNNTEALVRVLGFVQDISPATTPSYLHTVSTTPSLN
jgi:hypothetical protein